MSVKHLNQRQLAERWNVAEATLERWRSAGIGPVYLKLQGRVLYRVEDIEDPLMQKIRYLDKLVDELAKGKTMEKVLREPAATSSSSATG